MYSPTSSVPALKLSLYYLGLYYMCIRKLKKIAMYMYVLNLFLKCALCCSRVSHYIIFYIMTIRLLDWLEKSNVKCYKSATLKLI